MNRGVSLLGARTFHVPTLAARPASLRGRLALSALFAASLLLARPLAADDAGAPPAPRPVPPPLPPVVAPAAPDAPGEPTEAEGLVWRMERDGVTLRVPVGHLSEPVREVFRERLDRQGWRFLGEDAAAAPPAPRSGPADRPPVFRAPDVSPPPQPPHVTRGPEAARPAQRTAPGLRFVGATLLHPEQRGAGWRVGSVPTSSLAFALGLRYGDRVLSVNGGDGRDAVVMGDVRLRRGGQLTLLVARREGGVDLIEVAPLTPSAAASGPPLGPEPSREADPQEGSR